MNSTFKPPVRTVADLLHRLGNIPPDRVRFTPVPGTATVEDLLREENRRCELIDETLVEKPMGLRESLLAVWLGHLMFGFIQPRNLGILSGEQGTYHYSAGTVAKSAVKLSAAASYSPTPRVRLDESRVWRNRFTG